MIYKLQKNGKYAKPEIYSENDKIKVGNAIGLLIIDLKAVFNE